MPLQHAHYAVRVTAEQRAYADALVGHAMAHHSVSNVWDGDPRHAGRTRELRTTGTLGEVVFADAYGLARPERSFGADDGQDYGRDFVLVVGGAPRRVDVKAMGRRSPRLEPHYVLNVSARQLRRDDGETDLFAHVSLSPRGRPTAAVLVGAVSRAALLAGRAGRLFRAGAVRTRANGTTFAFYEDTYEIRMDAFGPLPPPAGPARERGAARRGGRPGDAAPPRR